jgi:hypothetical protein
MIKSKRMRWLGHEARMGIRRMHSGKYRRKKQLGGYRHRWQENDKMNVGEIG